LEPHAQTKLIRVLSGNILDAVVDIRKNSPTYGKAYTIELSAQNKKQLFVPKGFAHGYSVLSETAEVFYKCDVFYHKESEGGIAWNEPSLHINWQVPQESVRVSEKDSNYSILENCRNNFVFNS
jgi:dTDP-4-dehydrorhamnose 3,5-epimerase